MGRLTAADIDAVTLDAYDTLLTLVDPVPRLAELLPAYDRQAIHAAFLTEAEYYRAHSWEATDEASTAAFHDACASTFNEALGSSLSSEEYNATMQFEPLPGVAAALARLRDLGLSLAVVGNWDFTLHRRLAEHGLVGFFSIVVAAANKPAPDGILRALAALQVDPSRALHIGDETGDEEAARAAGVHFAPAPLPDAVATLLA
jgi:phosphoglycolate phosphatase-like HAD superfamily hydrolase